MAAAERRLSNYTSTDTHLRRGQMRLLGDDTGRPLTPRQSQVLQLTAQSMTQKQIAKELGISTETVKNHLSSIYTRLASDKAGVVFQNFLSGVVDNSLTEAYDLTKIFTLTSQEADVLEVLTQVDRQSTSNASIGQELNIAEKTVINRLGKIMQKLGVDNRISAGLIFIAAAENLVALEDEYAQRTNDFYEEKPKDVLFSNHDVKALKLLAEGKTYKEIAKKLGLKESTLKASLGKVYTQLHVDNGLAAVFKASHLGLINLREHNSLDLGKYRFLTQREREILDELTIDNGKQSTNKEIAKKLGITVRTVKDSLYTIASVKLSTSNRITTAVGYKLWLEDQSTDEAYAAD